MQDRPVNDNKCQTDNDASPGCVPEESGNCCPSSAGTGLTAIKLAPAGMIERLRKMIEARDPYFILTGSDPSETGGCCPSDDIGAANSLVAADILEFWTSPAGTDACPSVFYAFAGEIGSRDQKPSFTINEDLRQEVLNTISNL